MNSHHIERQSLDVVHLFLFFSSTGQLIQLRRFFLHHFVIQEKGDCEIIFPNYKLMTSYRDQIVKQVVEEYSVKR
jgi:hypothetical protein